MKDKKDEKEPIKVTDRRAFTLDGERRSETPEPPEREPIRIETPAETVQGEGFQLKQGAAAQGQRPPEVEFSSFILSLASTAFIQLGELEDPATGRLELNLEGAHQMIEILDMLHARTKGNLDAQEEEFFSGILYELKLKYTQKVKRP